MDDAATNALKLVARKKRLTSLGQRFNSRDIVESLNTGRDINTNVPGLRGNCISVVLRSGDSTWGPKVNFEGGSRPFIIPIIVPQNSVSLHLSLYIYIHTYMYTYTPRGISCAPILTLFSRQRCRSWPVSMYNQQCR